MDGLFKRLVSTALAYYSTPAASPQKHSTFNSDDVPGVWRPLLGIGLYDLASAKSYYKSFAYACINKKAYNLSKAKIYLYRQFKSKKTEQPPDHPFLKLINAQNGYKQSFREMLFSSAINCDMYGNAYLLVNYINMGPFGRLPASFTPLPARYVTPHLDSQNEMIEYYYYTGGGTQKKYMPDEIIRFKVPSPDSNLFGHAPVSAFNFTLDIEYLQSRYQRKFFDNDATPGFVLSAKTNLSDESYARLEAQYNARHAGVDNARRPLITEGDMTVTEVGLDQKEMDFVQSRKQILDEVMLILDVSKQVMHIFEDSNYNNSQNALMSWVKNTLEPYASMVFNEKLTAFVYDNYDKKLITSMEFDLTNDELELREIELFSKEKLATKNELRELRGWDTFDDPRADELFPPEKEEDPDEKETEPINQNQND